jgi:acyl-CoA thioester hydrolase
VSNPDRVPAAFTFPVRVYYEDTDAAGVVYHANYFRYFERARTEWLEALGYSPAELARTSGIVFVVRRVEADFRAPARLAQTLDVTVAIRTLGRASVGVRQHARRDDAVLVAADVELACVATQSLKPARIPAELWDRLTALAERPS